MRARFTIWGGIAGLMIGACLVIYEAAVGPVLPGSLGSLVLHALVCGAIGGFAGWFIQWTREGDE